MKINLFLRLSLSLGLGLGISASITFLSFVIFDRLQQPFVVAAHFLLLASLFLGILFRWKTNRRTSRPLALPENSSLRSSYLLCGGGKEFSAVRKVLCFPTLRKIALEALPRVGLMAGIIFLLWTQANFYPLGGWDAWSVWNLKSRFLFLGADHWKNMFDPILWRSSPHYPLFLPLTNVWGWMFLKEPSPAVPLLTSIIFAFLTIALLFSGLKALIKTFPALLAALLLTSSSTFIVYATSQYCDIVLAYFLLAGLFCLLLAKLKDAQPYALLSGLFLGFLSFTKPEGTLASVLIAGLAVPYLLHGKEKISWQRHPLTFLLEGLLLGSLPTILFHWLYAPTNQTFINGLESSSHPMTGQRLQVIGMYFIFELISRKWYGIWVLLLTGLLLSQGRCLSREKLIVFVFLLLYGVVTGLYYWLNTYFAITWWLRVTLPRLLCAILPVMIFWVFYSVWGKNPQEQ